MNDKPIVYVVQDARGKNLQPAREFGELQVMLHGRTSNKTAYAELVGQLISMRQCDYLLLIGDPMYIAMASHITLSMFSQNGFGEVQFLVWDREHYNYKVERISDGHKPVNQPARK